MTYEIQIVPNDDDWGSKTDDPLKSVFFSDNASTDYPEDLCISRDIGGWISEVNRLRRALFAVDPDNSVFTET